MPSEIKDAEGKSSPWKYLLDARSRERSKKLKLPIYRKKKKKARRRINLA